MYPIKYYDIVKDYSNPFNLRLKMVQLALRTSIRKAALEFGTTRKTVRKYGVNLKKVTLQTDNGSEYINSSRLTKRLPVFTNKDYPQINPNVLNLPPVILETHLKSYREPSTYLEEEKLKAKYVKLGLPIDSGYLLPYLSMSPCIK